METAEGGGILREASLDGCELTDEALKAMADGHSGGNAMGVDYHVGHDAVH